MAEIPDGSPERDTEDNFDRQLRQDFQNLARDRGPCISEEMLALLAERKLPPGLAREAERHVTVCGICELRLMNIEGSLEPLRGRFPAFFRRFFWNPALAYVLVLLLAIPAYRGLWPDRGQPRKSSPIQPLQVLNLNRERGETASAATASGEYFALEFWIPEVPGRAFEASIETAAGLTINRVSALNSSGGQGNFRLLCRRTDFPNGSYRLIVKDANDASAKSHVFPFELR